jgi:hypothetical protein
VTHTHATKYVLGDRLAMLAGLRVQFMGRPRIPVSLITRMPSGEELTC